MTSDDCYSTFVSELAAGYRAAHEASAPEEQVALDRAFSTILTHLPAPEEDGANQDRADAFGLIAAMLASVRRRPIAIHERPAWLTASVLGALRDEAAVARAGAVRCGTSWFADVGSAAWRDVVASPQFAAWLCDRMELRPEDLERRVAMGYLYYDRAAEAASAASGGDEFRPHVDSPHTHAIHCLVCLEHEAPDTDPTECVLRLYDGPDGARDLALAPGDVVLFDADGTAHALTPLAPRERVVLLSIGFCWRRKV